MSSTVAETLWSGAGVALFLALVLLFSWLALKRKPLALVVIGPLVFVGPSLLQVDRTWLLQRLSDDWLPVLLLGIVVGFVLQLVSRAAVTHLWSRARPR